MTVYLHEEIIINILQRLPVETLLRCTGVCKSWYSLITSPQFISDHLKLAATSKNRTHLLLMRRFIGNLERYELYSDNESFTRESTLQFQFRSMDLFFTIVGSCNGLLCLSDNGDYKQRIILWNPCIRKVVRLPRYKPFNYLIYKHVLGFGFDPIASDYKVVRIVDGVKPHVQLYKMSTGMWHDISYVEQDYFTYKYNGSRQAYVNGATHWIARNPDLDDMIVSFDMSHEVFGKMMLPVSLAKNLVLRNKDLVVFMDSLALVSWNLSYMGEPHFCVWVMKEYGVEDSWTKHLSIDLQDFNGMRPLWVKRNGEVVMVWKDGHLYSYDPNEEEFKDLGDYSSIFEKYRPPVHVDSYMKSLVLLDKGSLHF